MNLEQILAEAKDVDCIRIYVGSAAGNSTAASVFSGLQAATEGDGLKAKVIATGSFDYYDLVPTVFIERPGQSAVLYRVPCTAKTVYGHRPYQPSLSGGKHGYVLPSVRNL